MRSPLSGAAHVGLDRGQVVGAELSVAERDQPVAERPAVEAVPSTGCEAGEHERQTGPTDASPGPRRLLAEFGQLGRDGSSRLPSEATRSGLAGKPSRPRADGPGRGRHRVAALANRSCSANHPSTQPGTVTDAMSRLNGISRCPPARNADGSAPEPARPLALRACTSPTPCAGSTWTRANRSPPIPQRWGAVTAMAALVAIAASTALPPSMNIELPADVAR